MRNGLFGSGPLVLAVLAFGTVAIATSRSAPARDDHEREGTNFGPGCAPERPAIPHHAGGVTVQTPRGKEHKPPIPCATKTGFRTSEVSIAVTNSGTILFQPVLADQTGTPIGILSSADRGGNWGFVAPSGPLTRTRATDMNIWVDRQTGRVFWSSELGPPVGGGTPRVDHSDDNGKTWVPSATLPMPFDHTQVFTGSPPASLKRRLQEYPNVVYAVVSGGFTCVLDTPPFCGTHITKSLDGGLTFGPAVALPFPAECPVPGVNPTGGYGLNGVVDRDGTLFLPFTPCERPYVAISHDAGDTWQLALVADIMTIGWGELGLGMDKAGNLYAAWVKFEDRLPYLAISRDHGLHWSAPLMIGAPGVIEAAVPQLVAGARGQVAVTYYGSKNAPLPFTPPCTGPSLSCPGFEHETWDTYITESFNALADRPLFWSASLNDPALPTWYGVTPSSIRTPAGFNGASGPGTGGTSGGGRLDYYGMTMAPDDTPWVGFGQACPFGRPVAGNPNCPSTLTGTGPDSLWGFVGRLVSAKEREDEHED